jgi:hypothetical protein
MIPMLECGQSRSCSKLSPGQGLDYSGIDGDMDPLSISLVLKCITEDYIFSSWNNPCIGSLAYRIRLIILEKAK